MGEIKAGRKDRKNEKINKLLNGDENKGKKREKE
jgi:hypothetical protein